jgi:SAM-dependent methyltransferase
MPSFYYAPVRYHGESLNRQKRDETLSMLERAAVVAARCVVDVGCGAGQTLRLVGEVNPDATLVGIDPDSEALAAGFSAGGRVHFLRAEGERLPLGDGVASHVICRVAINYMHQERALGELCRILAPGGRLVLSYHGFGYNLKEAVPPVPGGLRQWLGNVKDLIAGLALQAFGVQGRRGAFWGRSVPYLSSWRLRRWLRRLNCKTVYQEPAGRFWGFVATWWVVIQKGAK